MAYTNPLLLPLFKYASDSNVASPRFVNVGRGYPPSHGKEIFFVEIFLRFSFDQNNIFCSLKGKFSSGREGALASNSITILNKNNYQK